MSQAYRLAASLSLDVDNLWSYLKVHGEDGWRSRPSYLPTFLPLVLEACDALSIRITFFLVGLDAAEDRNGAALREVAAHGHEFGNHSFEHEPWLHRYAPEQVRDELGRADAAIRAATGRAPVGFRGPGFSWSPAVLQAVSALGYAFDASTLPTFIGPLARAYYFATARMTAEERHARNHLFGAFSDGLRPLKPYHWSLPGMPPLLEIPVTTMPGTRTPFHLSYLLYLAQFSDALARAYLRTALALCRLTRTEPSLLLHPLDLIGGDAAPQLRFFPGMHLSSAHKQVLFRSFIGIVAEHFELIPMGEHARRLESRAALELRPAA
jgi:hypothetical protein